jgi:ATP-dependent DNA ligase
MANGHKTGFRALAHIDFVECRLVSRKGTVYKSLPRLCKAISVAIPAHTVLDGEIVHLDAEGKSQFYELMRRSTIMLSICSGWTAATSGNYP